VIKDKKKLAELKVRRRERIRSFYLMEEVWQEFDRIGIKVAVTLGRSVGDSELLSIMIEEFGDDQV
jgi:hypothetical protein